MLRARRSDNNPFLSPDPESSWESEAVFNGCPVFEGKKMHLLYRAMPFLMEHEGKKIGISTIGYAEGSKDLKIKERRQLIKPEYDWEKFGCEDPRVTKLNGKYYIFYTALSQFPFAAGGIKTAVAITKDFRSIKEKHPVSTFNAKAMALFPAKINGKMVAILTAHTDMPPAKICLAYFDEESDIWSEKYWNKWYASLDSHTLSFRRSSDDHVEVGAPPVKTKYGWLVVFSYIKNYFSPSRIFGIEAVLLDLKNLSKIVGRTEEPIMVPEEDFELYGTVPNVIFPSGAVVDKGNLYIYYGAADTRCARAEVNLNSLLRSMLPKKTQPLRLGRYLGNPIISPIPGHDWESKATFNAASIYLDKKIHLLYRALSEDNTSRIGYASSKDGFVINERSEKPVYIPREDFENKISENVNSGCEDPRITKIGGRLYMLYTAYRGTGPTRVALTSIDESDFLKKRWKWSRPVLISPPYVDDKDAALFPKKIKGKYAILHRIGLSIWIDFVDDLDFKKNKWLDGNVLMHPREGERDSRKIGIAGPPIETKYGWVLIYHGISKKENHHYHLRAALLDLSNPEIIIGRTKDTIFEPEASYEAEGIVLRVVFSCGAVLVKNTFYVYYGGADKVIGVATITLNDLMKKFKEK